MRVISGENKGQRLLAPKGKNTRPTEDRVKESIFNIIMPIDSESIVLDIFSGSGQIGIEFLSRGALRAYFIDNSRESISIINENLERTRLKDRAFILKNNYLKALKYLNEENIAFDYIYMDPPFKEYKLYIKSLEMISNYKILKEDGIFLVEHDKGMELGNIYDLKLTDNRKYGNVDISIYNKR